MIKEKNEAEKGLENVGWREEGHNFKVVRDSLMRKYCLNEVPEEGMIQRWPFGSSK